MQPFPVVSLAVALGVGLLIGGERERRKRAKRAVSTAGIRTFAVAAVAGAIGFQLGGAILLAVVVAAVAVLTGLARRSQRADDPGVTTETALVLTMLIGALAVGDPTAAASVGVTVAILLAARTPLHHFVNSVLSEGEVRDALIFAGASLVVLPLLPNQAMGPYGALNPHAIWIVVVLVLAIGGVGHMAVRGFGARLGLPLAGLMSGFVSSTATIGAMGARVRAAPLVLPAAVAGAVLSTVATLVEMGIVIGATSLPTLKAMAGPLACAGLAAVVYGAAFTLRALRQPAATAPRSTRAFNLIEALLFAATLAAILLASAALRVWFGPAGGLAAAALGGLVDTHAAAISVALTVAGGRLAPQDAVLPILAALSANTLTKLLLAVTSGGRAFAVRVVPGLVLVIVAAWAGALWL